MQAFNDFTNSWLGLSANARDLTFLQISLRGIIVFLVTLLMVRCGHKRSLARKTPFDAVLIVILASVLARAINGNCSFWPTLGGGFVLVLVHRLLASLAFSSHTFGLLIKGRPERIVCDGQMDIEAMRRNHVSTHDVEEDLRLSARRDSLNDIRLAYVERSGDISFVPQKRSA